tara:strand:+ start:1204 stop:1446 length:243 start_codon:yes stop_codon:yes gene_type:complete
LRKLKPVLAIFVIPLSFLLMGCSTNSESRSSRALFKTRAEAEKAAKDFNCTGAHKMGDRWMPCKSHNLEKHSKDGGHHHH